MMMLEEVEDADAGGEQDELMLRGDEAVVRERRERANSHSRARAAIQAELEKLAPLKQSVTGHIRAVLRNRNISEFSGFDDVAGSMQRSGGRGDGRLQPRIGATLRSDIGATLSARAACRRCAKACLRWRSPSPAAHDFPHAQRLRRSVRTWRVSNGG